MDYFAYEKNSSCSRAVYSNDSTPEECKSGSSLPTTPTIYVHDTGKSPSKPTCIRYSASIFAPDSLQHNTEQEKKQHSKQSNSHKDNFDLSLLSKSLPSPPSTPQCPPAILPSLSLPSNKSPLTKRRFSYPPGTTFSPRLRILLVDDNIINLQILSRLLNRHMSNIVEHIELVKSGIKALEVLKCRPFDLILMDIDMPIMNGVETTKHIRSTTTEHDILLRNRSIPIVAVTTNDSLEWRQTYDKIGMNGFIGKPISPQVLKSTLSKILDLNLPIPPYTPE